MGYSRFKQKNPAAIPRPNGLHLLRSILVSTRSIRWLAMLGDDSIAQIFCFQEQIVFFQGAIIEAADCAFAEGEAARQLRNLFSARSEHKRRRFHDIADIAGVANEADPAVFPF
jgi:hypothetical protein